jgi:hypothetical protein
VIWVTLAALVLVACTIYLSATILRGMVRQQARERELLLNQIMHLAGRTWQPPPELERTAAPQPQMFEVDPLALDPSAIAEYEQ